MGRGADELQRRLEDARSRLKAATPPRSDRDE
jgi:hypothetical protein